LGLLKDSLKDKADVTEVDRLGDIVKEEYTKKAEVD